MVLVWLRGFPRTKHHTQPRRPEPVALPLRLPGGARTGRGRGPRKAATTPRIRAGIIGCTCSRAARGLRLRYRYYTQTEADDYQEHYPGTAPGDLPEFRTQDAELASFNSHGLGARFDLTPGGRHGWYLDLNYSLRSDDLDGYFASVGYYVDF